MSAPYPRGAIRRNRSSDTIESATSESSVQPSLGLATVKPDGFTPIADAAVTQSLPGEKDAVSPLDVQQPPTGNSSLHTHVETEDAGPSTSSATTPSGTMATSRFRSAARKIIAVSRTSQPGIKSPGAEQGADPRRQTAEDHWGHIRENCVIDITDYSSLSVSVTKLDNQGLQAFLAGEGRDRPAWARVRWINVGGISWDVMRCLALRYELHPLAVETVLRWGESTRTKSDYFRNHLFISVISHTLAHGDNQSTYVNSPLTSTPTKMTFSADNQEGSDRRPDLHQRLASAKNNLLRRTRSRDDIEETIDLDAAVTAQRSMSEGMRRSKTNSWLMTAFGKIEDDQRAANAATLEILKAGAGHNVQVELKHIYMFLTKEGTLITIHQDTDMQYFQPLAGRLQIKDSLLRAFCDASLLMQSALDLVVDKALEVVEGYHDSLLDLERRILIKPDLVSVKRLHIMSGDLMLHKRTLTPLSTLVYSLRKYDRDRTIAALPGSEEEKPPIVTGFCSHQAKVYLADVCDHMDFILSSMEMFGSISENLINFTFNQVSYDTNQSMRRLTVATVTFFPATFLTGYFGMNFHGSFFSLQFSDLFFWIVAIPVLVLVIIGFTWPEIAKLFHGLERKRVYETAKARNTWHKSQ